MGIRVLDIISTVKSPSVSPKKSWGCNYDLCLAQEHSHGITEGQRIISLKLWSILVADARLWLRHPAAAPRLLQG
jgi:hypothetical protein